MNNIRTRTAVTIAAALLAFAVQAQELPAATPEEVGLSAERLARLDAVMQQHVDNDELAGAVILIARHGKIAHLKALGKASIEKNDAMQTGSMFRIFSMTKVVTSVALLTLFEEGRFQLQDPAEMYIPAFKNLKVLDHVDEAGKMVLVDQQRKMTVHDLFRHTAGLAYGFGNTLVEETYRKAGITGLAPMPLPKLMDALGTAPLMYQPGTKWMYSYAHDVQAYLVQHLSGKPFPEYLRTRIFEPLGMNDTSFGLADGKLDRYTTMYGPKGFKNEMVSFEYPKPGIEAIDTPEKSEYLDSGRNPMGGSGLVSTATDYYRFAQMLLNGGEFNGRRILGRKTVELMRSNHLPPGVPGFPGAGGGYGLGVSVLTDVAAGGAQGSAGQFGWSGAANTHVIIDPAEQMVSILMLQLRPYNISLIRQFQIMAYQAIAD